MKGNFDSVIQDSRPVIVDFHAVWCAPCKIQTPILKDVAAELGDKVRIIKIDVDQNNQIAGRYNVQSVPMLIIFKRGKLVWKHSGVTTKSKIMNIIALNS
jgi:thioredoxin 1